MKQLIIFVLFLATAPSFAAEDGPVKINTRPGVSVSFFSMKRDGAKATVVLLPGGGGGIGVKDGIPTSKNFLVRSRDHFAAQGFNVAVVGRPTDQSELDYSFRVSPKHIEDLRRVTAFLRKDPGMPVWLIGTSSGTISATSAAIAFGNEELAGIVLTASVTSDKKPGAVPYQKLGVIRIPVLVLHHEYDACKICKPREASWIIRGLKNAPVKKMIFVKGGKDPSGDPCEAMHWHGFIGMEKEAVEIITNWIAKPSS